MSVPTKVLKGGKPIKDPKQGFKWKIKYKDSSGKWTSGVCWGKKINDAYMEIAARQDKPIELPPSEVTWQEGHALWDKAHDKPGANYKSDSYRYQMDHNVKLFTDMVGDIPIESTTKSQLSRFFAKRAELSAASANRARCILALTTWLRQYHDLEFPYRSDDFPKFKEIPQAPRQNIELNMIGKYIQVMRRLPERTDSKFNYKGNQGRFKNAGSLILRYLFLSGVRSSEACNLKESGISGDILTFIQKGQRTRSIRATPEIMKIIRTSLLMKRWGGIEHDYVFFNTKGRPWNKDTIRHYWKRRIEAANAAGIDLPERKIHEIRHTFCTLAGSQNFSEKMIQSASGHASLSVLQKYTHSIMDMQEQVTTAVDDLITPFL